VAIIRELQNIVERSVILCDTETFSVDENWLSFEPSAGPPLPRVLVTQERERVEAALAASKGRVSGPSGAAKRLGMPRSTLESRIKSLKIDKTVSHQPETRQRPQQVSSYLTRSLPRTRHFPKTSSVEWCVSHVFSALWNWPVPCIRTAELQKAPMPGTD
jgi:Bacterial regulatory protein, Fis family